MTIDVEALTTKWATLTGTTLEKLAQLRALTVTANDRDVPMGELAGYLYITGITTKMKDYLAGTPSGSAKIGCTEILGMISNPNIPVIQTSIAGVKTAFGTWLSAMQTASVLTAGQVTAIAAMSSATKKWWTTIGFESEPCLGDILAVGLS